MFPVQTFSFPDQAYFLAKNPTTIAEFLRVAIGDVHENIVLFNNSQEVDKQFKSLVQSSDVANCQKWSEMHDFAHELNDQNLETTLIDDVELNLHEGLNELHSVVASLNTTAQFDPREELVFFAYTSDQEEEQATNIYHLFILNEVARAIEEYRDSFKGLAVKSVLIMVINRLQQKVKQQLSKQCFELIANLQCTLADVAASNDQYWNEDSKEWLND